jgi:hypothetical protein
MFRRLLLSAAFVALFAGGAAQAGTLLQDDFNGPALSSPGAVGSGFAVGSGGAYVSGGLAYVGTDPNTIDQNIYSLNTFNPAGTQLTWVVDQRPVYGAAGAAVGWAQPDIYTCAGCGPEIWLEARDDRTVFDVVDNNGLNRYWSSGPIGGSGPITMTMRLTDIGFAWSISDTGASISDSGLWAPGFAISDVITAAGGDLSTFGGTRSDAPYLGDVGTFDSVLVTSVPEPETWALLLVGLGGLGAALRARRRADLKLSGQPAA